MPALSSTMTEGKIVSWLKQPGDKVSKGEPIVVVESDKGKCFCFAHLLLRQRGPVCQSPGLEAGIAVLPTARVCTVCCYGCCGLQLIWTLSLLLRASWAQLW
jgi:hypothetical protein